MAYRWTCLAQRFPRLCILLNRFTMLHRRARARQDCLCLGVLWELFRKNKDFADSLAEAQNSRLLAILLPPWTTFA
jgi:hypothetical protein